MSLFFLKYGNHNNKGQVNLLFICVSFDLSHHAVVLNSFHPIA